MFESSGGNFQDGSPQNGGFQLIKEYFQQKTCKHCSRNYTSDGIEFIREEPGMVVVRVGCSGCGQPLGIALVGMSGGGKHRNPYPTQQRLPDTFAPDDEDMPYPADWTKADIQRLSKLASITYDDVLDAHAFFSNLSDDWCRHLPKRSKKSAKAISAG
jgi:hypothetical protein